MSTTFYEDEDLRFNLPDKTFFVGRATYVENEGQRIFVVTTDQKNFQELQNKADQMATYLKEKYFIPTERLTYYERHPDGTIDQVDHKNLGPGPDVNGVPGPKEPRTKVLEEQVLRELDGGKLPSIGQELDRASMSKVESEKPWDVRNFQKEREKEPKQEY